MKNLNNCTELGMIINATYKTVILLHEILGLPEYPDYIKNLLFFHQITLFSTLIFQMSLNFKAR